MAKSNCRPDGPIETFLYVYGIVPSLFANPAIFNSAEPDETLLGWLIEMDNISGQKVSNVVNPISKLSAVKPDIL